MKKLKQAGLLSLVSLLAVSTVACSAPATSSSSSTSSSKKPSSITVTYMSGNNEKAALESASAFKTKEGVTVNVAAFPYSTLIKNNTNDIISGNNQYSVMSGGAYLVDIFKNMTPLDSYIKKNNFGRDYINGLLEKANKYNGKTVGIPYGVDSYGIVYRKDLFEKYGIKLPSKWSDYDDMLKELKAKLPSDIAAYTFAGGAPEQIKNLFLTRYTGTYITKDHKYHIDSAKAVSAINEIKVAYSCGPSNITSLSIDQSNALFLQGKAAVTECWPTFIMPSLVDSSKCSVMDKWAIGSYPTDGGKPQLSCWNLFIPKKCADVDTSWKWITSSVSEKSCTENFLKYGTGSPYKSTYKDAEVVKKYGSDALTGETNNISKAADFPLDSEGQTILTTIVGDALVGKVTPQQAVDQINNKFASLTPNQQVIDKATRDGFIEK